ncbi:hypothetical protein F4820DRAFT_463194 [Hypoxylon rubiginosum]|uniref:Uncharacterized protein n=1 Tax=Hypoxylon rubiginosum TaxID=110542 RepID=A0ACB9YH86_9PEZI|nr:hypothetical protein F4820DRAFT_463194 [Hypoxylon rubiginosum]
METTPQPESLALTLYRPQDYELVMKDAPDLAVSDVVVTNPPEWILQLHAQMQDSYNAIRTLATQVDVTHRENQEVRESYNALCAVYNTIAQMYSVGIEVSAAQIVSFRHQVEQSSQAFSQQVWGTIAKFADDNTARQAAIDKLAQVAQEQHLALESLRTDFSTYKKTQDEIAGWATTRDPQINELLTREYVNPAQLDQASRKQLSDLQAYTEAALAEFTKRLAANQPIDVQSVLESIGRQAASKPNSRRSTQTGIIPGTYPLPVYSSSEARMRNQLSTRALRTSQVRRTAANAQVQFDSARAGPLVSGGNGRGNPPPPPNDPSGDPDDSDDEGNGPPPGPPRGPPPPRTPHTEPTPPTTPEDRLVRALERLVRPAPATINPVHLNKPTAYDGEDLSKFRPWYLKSFPEDYHRINWIGSLLTVRQIGLVDLWASYELALKERFKDPSERHRNSKKMSELKYHGDVAQYLTEMLDLNESVQWSGTTFQNHIAKTLPDEITKLVYSRQGGLPDSDEEFIDAIQEAGQIYENMLTNPGISGKGKPDSTTEQSKSGHQPRGKDDRSKPGQNQSSKKQDRQTSSNRPDSKDKRWASNKEALQGIDQADIDQRKKDKCPCWRCGRDNHGTLSCFAKKDVNGKELPAAPGKVASAKRKSSDDTTPAPTPAKKAKIDSILTEPPFQRITEEDSDSDF